MGETASRCFRTSADVAAREIPDGLMLVNLPDRRGVQAEPGRARPSGSGSTGRATSPRSRPIWTSTMGSGSRRCCATSTPCWRIWRTGPDRVGRFRLTLSIRRFASASRAPGGTVRRRDQKSSRQRRKPSFEVSFLSLHGRQRRYRGLELAGCTGVSARLQRGSTVRVRSYSEFLPRSRNRRDTDVSRTEPGLGARLTSVSL